MPCRKLFLLDTPTMEAYEQLMGATLTDLRQRGATVSIFGDIFLEDLRRYREAQLAKLQLQVAFPLWGAPTAELIREFMGLGFKTITTCVNEKYLDQSFVGRVIDEQFLGDLPAHVDPCGENGEFHTFVFDGPLFNHPISFTKGEIVHRKYTPAPKTDTAGYDCAEPDEPSPFATGFWYCDLLPTRFGN